MFQIVHVICEHQKLLETNTDPLILGLSVIGRLRDLLSD
jgi:hypothetical protein